MANKHVHALPTGALARLGAGNKPSAVAAAALWSVGMAIALSHGGPPAGPGDFIHDFYPAGRQVLHGYLTYTPPPYTPTNVNVFRYPPFAALVLAPFALASVHTALFLWWCTSIALVALSAVLASCLLSAHRRLASGVLFLGFMSFGPIGTGLDDRVDPVVLALVAGALLATHRSCAGPSWQPFSAGVLMGVAIAFKLYPALALVVVLSARPRGARHIIAGCATALVLTTALVVAVIGVEPLAVYGKLAGSGSTVLTAVPFAFGAMNLAARLVEVNPYAPHTLHLSPHIVAGGFLLYVATILVVVASTLRSTPSRWSSSWALGLGVTAACSPFLEDAHLVTLALIPAVLVTDSKYPREAAVLLAGLAAVCTLAAMVAPSHVAEGVSGAAVAVGSGYVWRGTGTSAALLTGSVLVLAAPCFAAISAYWPSPISLAHVLVGSLDLLGVLTLLAALVVLSTDKSHRAGLGSGSATARP